MYQLGIDEARDILSGSVWQHPEYYGGYSPDGEFVIYSRHRDSDLLTDHNYETILKTLTEVSEKHDPPDREQASAYDWRASHWAVGWVEYIMVADDAPDEVLIAAADIISALADYPLLDEMAYSDKEWDAMQEVWENMSVRERAETIREHCNNVSLFAARRPEIPEDDFGHIQEALREGL